MGRVVVRPHAGVVAVVPHVRLNTNKRRDRHLGLPVKKTSKLGAQAAYSRPSVLRFCLFVDSDNELELQPGNFFELFAERRPSWPHTWRARVMLSFDQAPLDPERAACSEALLRLHVAPFRCCSPLRAKKKFQPRHTLRFSLTSLLKKNNKQARTTENEKTNSPQKSNKSPLK